MRKYTKTTFKTFLKKNAGKLWIKNLSHFDSMEDGVRESTTKEYRPVTQTDIPDADNNTYGINGAWLVGSGRDYFSMMYDAGFTGIRVDNCCGAFIIAVKNEAA